MSDVQVTSKQFSLDFFDLGKSAVIFFLTSFVTAIAVWIDGGNFPTWAELFTTIKIAGLATLSYLIKQFLTPSVVQKPAQ